MTKRDEKGRFVEQYPNQGKGQFKEQGPNSFDEEEASDVAWDSHRKRVLERFNINNE